MEEKQVKDRKLENPETRKLEELRKGDIIYLLENASCGHFS